MSRSTGLLYLVLVLVLCWGFTLGLTWAPCYASLCSEEFYAYDTRVHTITYYAILASTGCALLLRAYSPACRSISSHYLTKREVPVMGKRVSVGGLLLGFWIVTLTLVTTVFWVTTLSNFWAERTGPLQWSNAHVSLVVTGIIGHHADILLGLLLIPVSRNSVLGRVFALHQSTLLYAHKLLAYLLVIAVAAHGATYFTFIGAYADSRHIESRREAFDPDNPTLTMQEAKKRGDWYSATLPTGVISLAFLLVITTTALPVLRRRNYNTFYYAHLICSSIILISASIHASTDFYFLLPGLVLWAMDWAWRIFRGDTGVMKTVNGKLEDAGYGWYRISLPVSVKTSQSEDPAEDEIAVEKQHVAHPLQTYYINIPSISRLQNHAFTAAKVGSSTTGPVFLFQRAQGSDKMNQKTLSKEWTWKVGGKAIAVDDVSLEKSRALEIRVEGPYVPAENGYHDVDRIICVVGGTGLTGAYSLALWWLEHRAHEAQARFTLIWTVRHRETANLPEWQQLVEWARLAGNMNVIVYTSSQDGRLDVRRSLRDSLATTGEGVPDTRLKAWVYLSGPAGLLSKAEDACVDLEEEIKQARKRKTDTRLAIDSMEHYSAKWEV